MEACGLVDQGCFESRWLGMIGYDEAWELQRKLASQVAAGHQPPTLLLLEHPHVFTLGRQTNNKHLLWDEAQISERGVLLRAIDRGGDITYHGPGQLVGYPIIPLRTGDEQRSNKLSIDVVNYVRKLEKTLIFAMANLGLITGQRAGLTGVWVQADVISRCLHCDPALRKDPAKIASIGIKVDSRGVTQHGFALNVNPDMSYFEGVVPCGIEGVTMTSLAELLNPAPGMAEVVEKVIASFSEVFGYVRG
jgi:lipoyl(octanoyl) transferase